MVSLKSAPLVRGVYRYNAQERVLHGRPFDQEVAEEISASGAQRVLVIATEQARGAAMLQRLQSTLGPKLTGVFYGVSPHVPVDCVLDAAALARQLKADHLVALGGGSVIDAAKAVALSVRHDIRTRVSLLQPQDLSAFDASRRAEDDAQWLRITAVPMTLSAAEFTWIAGVTDPVARVKNIVGAPPLVPRTVIYDPELTLEVPLSMFLASGIKAIDHAVERLAALSSHPMCDALCQQALQMLVQALPTVHTAPEMLEPRLQCQLAAWLSIAGAAAGVRVGASHALGHVLGAHGQVEHGLTSCVMLASVMRWNHCANQAQQARISAAMGRSGEAVGDVLEELVQSLGLPYRLREVGVLKKDLPQIAAKSLHDPLMQHNPRPVRSVEDVLQILHLAW